MQAFISRTLAPDSPFRRLLQAAGWQVHGFPLIELRALPAAGDLPSCDWLFFSSRQAVDFFFEAYPTLPQAQWAALGPGTAEALLRRGIQPDFIGSGEPESTARAFGRWAGGQRVLFPGARQGRQSIQRQLADRLTAYSLAVYDNRPLPDPPALPDDDVLVFTSPLNVQAYFDRHTLLPHQRTVAIGTPTAAALRAFGLAAVRQAAAPTEADLARAVLEPAD